MSSSPGPARRLPGAARLRLVSAVVGLATLLAGCGDGERSQAPPPEGAVAAGTGEAARAGLRILAVGGNAVDAAVATALAQAVTEPGNAGLGGWGVAVVQMPGEEPLVVDVPAPETGGEVATPTLVALLHHLWQRHGSGSVTWAELVEPAERLAGDGFRLGRYAHRTVVREYTRLERDSAAAALTLNPNRAIPAEGSRLTNPELAETLRILGEDGVGAFYGGEIGRRMADAFEARGLADGAALPATPPAARERQALSGTFRGWRIHVPPEPYGGPELLRALELLERAPPRVWTASAAVRAPWVAEALAHAFGPAGEVEAYLASVPPLPVPPADTADLGGALPAPSSTAGGGGLARAGDEGGETTHLSVVDGDGAVVALTHTLGRPYGAGWPVRGLGFFLGLQASTPVPVTGRTDSTSLESTFEEREWLVPTIVTHGDTARVALGTPGGRPGVSALVQVLVSWLSGADSLEHAVEAPRLHVGVDGQRRGRIYLEGMVSNAADTTELVRTPAAWGDSVAPMAASRGFRVGERDTGLLLDGRDPWFGSVNAVGRVGGEWWVVADPRRDGVAVRLNQGVVPAPSTLRPEEGGEELPPLLPAG